MTAKLITKITKITHHTVTHTIITYHNPTFLCATNCQNGPLDQFIHPSCHYFPKLHKNPHTRFVCSMLPSDLCFYMYIEGRVLLYWSVLLYPPYKVRDCCSWETFVSKEVSKCKPVTSEVASSRATSPYLTIIDPRPHRQCSMVTVSLTCSIAVWLAFQEQKDMYTYMQIQVKRKGLARYM